MNLDHLGLAGIFLAFLLLEGLGRPPKGSVLLRRHGIGRWRMAGETRSWLRVVSLLPPFTTSIILRPADPGEESDMDGVLKRRRTARLAAIPLNLLGAVIALGLLVGLPLVLVRRSAWEFLLAALALLLLTCLSALTGSIALQRMGMPKEPARKMARRWLSPFAAPGAAQNLLELALADVPPPFAARLLLRDSELRKWLRPRAYDLLQGRASDPDLMESFPAPVLMALVRSQPLDADPAAAAWCPRCGKSFRNAVNCTKCPDVPLVPLKWNETWQGFQTTLRSTAPELARASQS
jgi:hypothetical protein